MGVQVEQAQDGSGGWGQEMAGGFEAMAQIYAKNAYYGEKSGLNRPFVPCIGHAVTPQ